MSLAAVLMRDEVLSQKWKQIYDEHLFPFDVRVHLDEWITQIPWEGVRHDREVDKHSQNLILQLYQEIQKKANDPQISPLDKLNLTSGKDKIYEHFHNQPVNLIDVIQNCLNQERLLVDSCKKDSNDRRQTQEDAELLKYKQHEDKVKGQSDLVRAHSQKTEKILEQFHATMDQATVKLSDLHDSIRDNMMKLQSTVDPAQQMAIQKKNDHDKSCILKINQELQNKKTTVKEVLLVGCKGSVNILNMCWRSIAHYQQQQKHLVCYLGRTPDGAIDSLNKICEIGGQCFISYLAYLDRALSDVSRQNIQNDDIKTFLIRLQAEMENILQEHLKNTFIITRQPQNVVKIVQSKSPQLNMCVRLLGGGSLGIAHTLPYVTVRVYTEQKLKEAMEAVGPTVEGVCKRVENGTDVPMSLKKPKDHILANLNNMVFRGVERFEKRDKEERVTDYKYGVVCYTTVTVRNKSYPLKVLSLPIVFTSQTSQEGPAKGTLLWDALSPLKRFLYEDPAHVGWGEMEKVMKGMFKESGVELNADQLRYIKTYILGRSNVQHAPEEEELQVTKDRFLRDKVHKCDFTRWMWLYACKNLIMEHVNAEWKDSMIYGFVGRVEAENLLKDKEPGTFLLRFREGRIEGSQKANKCAHLSLAVVSLDPTTGEKVVDHVKDYLTSIDIHKYGLTCVLKCMVDANTKEPLLQTLYPDTDFSDIIERYMPDSGDSSEGYIRTEFMIRVLNERGVAEGSLSPHSSFSGTSSSVGTPQSDMHSEGQTDMWSNVPLDLEFPPPEFDFQHNSMMSGPGQLSTINFDQFPQFQATSPPMVDTASGLLPPCDSNKNLNSTTIDLLKWAMTDNTVDNEQLL